MTLDPYHLVQVAYHLLTALFPERALSSPHPTLTIDTESTQYPNNLITIMQCFYGSKQLPHTAQNLLDATVTQLLAT
jgi:hypothetical protein